MTCSNHKIFEQIAAALDDPDCESDAGKKLMHVSQSFDNLREGFLFLYQCAKTLGEDDTLTFDQRNQIAAQMGITINTAKTVIDNFGVDRGGDTPYYTEHGGSDDGGYPVLIS